MLGALAVVAFTFMILFIVYIVKYNKIKHRTPDFDESGDKLT